MDGVILAGDGHGALAAARGLIREGLLKGLVTRDPDMESLGQEWDLPVERELSSADLSGALLVTAGLKQIVDKTLLQKNRVLNVHYSLLPKYRGLHSIVWALLNGEKEVGWSLHLMDHLIDHGPIVFQSSLPVSTHTSWELMLQCDSEVEQQLGKQIRAYLSGEIEPMPQDESQATFVGRRNLEDCRIDWHASSRDLDLFLRALVPPYPRPFFEHRGRRFELLEAEAVSRPYLEFPGRVVYRDETSVWIKTGDGLMKVTSLFVDGSPMSALEALPSVGIRLGSK